MYTIYVMSKQLNELCITIPTVYKLKGTYETISIIFLNN